MFQNGNSKNGNSKSPEIYSEGLLFLLLSTYNIHIHAEANAHTEMEWRRLPRRREGQSGKKWDKVGGGGRAEGTSASQIQRRAQNKSRSKAIRYALSLHTDPLALPFRQSRTRTPRRTLEDLISDTCALAHQKPRHLDVKSDSGVPSDHHLFFNALKIKVPGYFMWALVPEIISKIHGRFFLGYIECQNQATNPSSFAWHQCCSHSFKQNWGSSSRVTK